MGWGDLGANWGPNKDVTPNLNKLSESGKRFTDFHAAASVCGPSRASLLTGRLGLRNGITHNFGPASVAGLPRNETTLAEILKENGYNTGMIGKWHLGITKLYHPCSRGFNYYYGLPYSNDMGCVDVDSYNLPQCKRCPKSPQEFEDRSLACSNDDIALPLYENYDIIEQPANLTALGNRYVEKATSFLKEAKSKDQPFFLYVAPAHTHVPLTYAKRFTNSTSQKTVFSDTLHELDDMIGRIMTSLKDNGLYDNTITWFTGDNGPWSQKCQYSGSPGPYLGSWQHRVYNGGSTAKATTWEAGHREPTFVIWPGFVQANTTSGALASALDIFPTFLSIANVGLPPWREYDGVDITEVLLGHQQEAHKVLFHPNSGVIGRGNIETLRMGPYKVYWRTGGLEMDCQRRLALPVWHHTPVVFNVDLDPAESEPIISDANQLRTDFLLSVKTDNTTVADFSHSKTVIPCCDPTQYYCRCKRT
uniref:Sulfatase N-terminal domain-containing protein n=1 Tax=Ciona savignyi TaxID=51511 RepID=H2YJ36_CIOSA